MEIFIIIWVLIAHCIYMPFAVKFTNNLSSENLDDSLIEIYVLCILWPFVLAFCAIYLLGLGIILLRESIGKAWEYLGDIYWDIDCFVAYMQTVTRKP
jgi:hypothetical protein